MGTHMIPRNTKGEGRLLYIFSTKALAYVGVGIILGLPFYYVCKFLKLYVLGVIILSLFGLLGFVIGTFKIPNIGAFKVTSLLGGENIDDVIIRYINFKRKRNKIFITKEEA